MPKTDKELTAEIVTAYIAAHTSGSIPVDSIELLINRVHAAIHSLEDKS